MSGNPSASKRRACGQDPFSCLYIRSGLYAPRARGVRRRSGPRRLLRRSDAARAWGQGEVFPAKWRFLGSTVPDLVRRPFYTLLWVLKEICEIDEIGVTFPPTREPTVSTLPRTSPRLITTREAAELLHVSSRTILNWIEKDAIPYIELPASGTRHEYRIPVLALMQSLRGNYDLASDVRVLDDAATAAGITDDDLAAVL